MLDALRSFIGLRWTRFSWGLYNLLTSPFAVTLALLVFIAVMLLARSPRVRRWMTRGAIALLGTYWFVISPLFAIPATQLLVQFVPKDAGQAADAVVVLTRGREIEGDRYNMAVDMVATGRVPRVFVTGRQQSINLVEKVQQNNLAKEQILGTVCARTTRQEAYSAASILGPQGINSIVLITDSPHMLRSWLTFKSLGFSVIPHIAPLPQQVGWSDRSFLAVREYLGLISYAALGRFNQRPPESLSQPANDILEDFPAERCAITSERLRQWTAQR